MVSSVLILIPLFNQKGEENMKKNLRNSEDMEKILSDLENDFFRLEKMQDRSWLESTLHDCFLEAGKSGLLFSKKDTIESLIACEEDRKIVMEHFECAEMKPDCWIVHYITQDQSSRLFYRTSIWVREGNWKLFFHQASPLNEKTDQIKKTE